VRCVQPSDISERFSYVGCFKDDSDRDLDDLYLGRGYNPESCSVACQDYNFFSIQDGSQCFCDNSYSTEAKYHQVDDSECNSKGFGHGGAWRNSVYQQIKTSETCDVSVNFALGVPATSPDGLNPDGDGGEANYAVDGNLDNWWDQQDNAGSPHILELDLTGAQNSVRGYGFSAWAFDAHSPKTWQIKCDGVVIDEVLNHDYSDCQCSDYETCLDREYSCDTLQLYITAWHGPSPAIREFYLRPSLVHPIVPYEEYGDSNELISDQPPCNGQRIDDNQCRSKSTTVFRPATSSVESDFNGLLWSFGQFVDHDLDLIAEDEHEEVDIPFDSEHTFKFFRAQSQCENGEYGKRKNEISARIDLSQVYGSTLARENTLRDPNNLSKIKSVDSDVLPPSPDEIFCCGDIRCAENPFLTAQHVLWLKHHNILVDELVNSGTQLTGEDLYQEAKRQNIAIYQRIVDEEFLPALVGPTPPAITVNSGHWISHTYDSAKVDIGLLSLNGVGTKVSLELCRDMVLSLDVCEKQYISYSTFGECACTTVKTTGIATVVSGWKTYQISPAWHDEHHFSHGDMSISNLFANAAYRLHHLVNDKFDIDGEEDVLANHFFNAVSFPNHGKLDGWFTRLLKQKSHKFGATVVKSLQHALYSSFTKLCQGDNTDCRDLLALNCLRGVDIGLPTYNEVREMFGLPQREDFDWSTCDGKLEEVYGGDIDRVELFFGGSCEPPMTGAVLGETFLVIVKDQILRLRDNDPHWIGHQSRGFTYKEVIQRCTQVDHSLFHSDSSLLHHSSS